jgi:hypothetical protein
LFWPDWERWVWPLVWAGDAEGYLADVPLAWLKCAPFGEMLILRLTGVGPSLERSRAFSAGIAIPRDFVLFV